jgi:hypothetical protein
VVGNGRIKELKMRIGKALEGGNKAIKTENGKRCAVARVDGSSELVYAIQAYPDGEILHSSEAANLRQLKKDLQKLGVRASAWDWEDVREC